MKSSLLIGSLPHEDIDEAVIFSSQVSFPTLPTLPKLNRNEFMIEQALDGLSGVHFIDGQILCDEKIEVKDWAFPFCAKEIFFKKNDNRPYKWQIVGPSTLKALGASEKLLSLHLQRILHALKNFPQREGNILLLDEPILQDTTVLFHYQKKLEGQLILGVHSCAQLDLSTIREISSFNLISLDCLLYQQEELDEIEKFLNKKIIAGVINASGESLKPKIQANYFSPSCGLVLSSVERSTKILNALKEKIEI